MSSRRYFSATRLSALGAWRRPSAKCARQALLLGGLWVLTHLVAAQTPLLELDLLAPGTPATDAAYLYAQPGATLEFDGAYDAPKLPNSNGLNLASLTPTGQALAINAVPPAALAGGLRVPLQLGVPQDGTYVLQVGQLQNFGALTVYLTDAQQQMRQVLAAGTSYAFELTGASTGGTYVTSTRFALVVEAAPLPVTLVAFAAERLGADGLLKWTTASELNSAYFQVESSVNGTAFQALGRVAGASTSSQAHTYQFTDANLARYAVAQVYYRLHQVDANSTAVYSPVCSLTVPLEAGLRVQAYPNPSPPGAAVTVLLRTDQPGAATWQLTDGLGRVVRQQQVDLPAGASTLLLAGTSELATGVFVLRVRQGSQQQTLKLVRQ